MPRPLSTAEIEDFRDRLCEAATQIFAERGTAGFTMRELANRVGVSPMTPYRYFRDKDEILAAVRARAFDAFSAALETAFATGKDVTARTAGAGRAYIDFAFAHPEAYHLMFDILHDVEGRYPDLARAEERARATMTRHIHPLVDAGILHGDPVLIGHVYWTALHGAVMLKLSGKLSEEYDFDVVVNEAMRVITLGYSSGSGMATGLLRERHS